MRRWPQLREDALRKMYEIDAVPRDEILARLNAMPGDGVSLPALKCKVSSLRLRRPPHFVAAYTRPGMRWTDPRRVAVVVEMWPAGIPRKIIADAANALPGPTVTPQMVKHKAGELRLRRPACSPKPRNHVVIVRTDAWTPARNAKLREMAAEGLSPSQVLQVLNGMEGEHVTGRMLRRKLERSGLKLRPELRLPRPRIVSPPVGRPVITAPVVVLDEEPLPDLAPSPDGLVYAPFKHVRGWCRARGFDCDGTDMDRVNKVRSYYGVPPFVIDWTTGGARHATR